MFDSTFIDIETFRMIYYSLAEGPGFARGKKRKFLKKNKILNKNIFDFFSYHPVTGPALPVGKNFPIFLTFDSPRQPSAHKKFQPNRFSQGYDARKVNCSCVYSAYIFKPVLSRRNL